jgi:DNA-binding NarL/FixJ family response regulator
MNESTALRIVIADRQPIFRDGLKSLLMSECGITVVGETGDPDEAVELVVDTRADVLLLDVAMAGGLDVLRRLVSTPVKTLALSDSDDARAVMNALDFVRGVVLKESRSELLFTTIREVAAEGHSSALAGPLPWMGWRPPALPARSRARVLPFTTQSREVDLT